MPEDLVATACLVASRRARAQGLLFTLWTFASLNQVHGVCAHRLLNTVAQYGISDYWSDFKVLVGFACPSGPLITTPYPSPIPTTALASFPRSGSSFTRTLVERATGYQTSSLYCDTRLSKFQAECLGLDSPFLVKTHYPLSEDVDPELPHWKRFNRAVRVIRNPFDSIWSTYHFSLTGNHSARVDNVGPLTMENKPFLQNAVFSWLSHIHYWNNVANLPVHVVRYEDLRDRAVPTLQSILRFTLPVSMQPSLERLRCATVDDPRNDPYWSRKSPSFSAYHKYDAEAREWILKAVKDEWCQHDYNGIFTHSTELPAPIDCSNITSILSA